MLGLPASSSAMTTTTEREACSMSTNHSRMQSRVLPWLREAAEFVLGVALLGVYLWARCPCL